MENNDIFDVTLAEEAQGKAFQFAVSNPMLTKEYTYNVANVAQAPMFKAVTGKDFVPYGVNRQNNYPDQLIKLYTQSSLHSRILKTKVRQILGQGFIVDEADPAAKVTGDFISEINDGGESLFQVANKVILDWMIFGGFSFLVHWNQEWSKISAIEHIDFSKVRVPPVTNVGEIPFYWYSPDWQTQRPKKVGIPVFNQASAIENKLAFQKALDNNNSEELTNLIKKNGKLIQKYIVSILHLIQFLIILMQAGEEEMDGGVGNLQQEEMQQEVIQEVAGGIESGLWAVAEEILLKDIMLQQILLIMEEMEGMVPYLR